VFVEKTKATRIMLQQEGTENGRNVLGKDIWLRYFDGWAQVFKSRGGDVVVASDVRFRNEAEYISKAGILIKVAAPARNEERLQRESNGDKLLYDKMKSHSSECDLDAMDDNEYDIVLKNDPGDILDVSELYAKLDKALKI
jgi:hypothetical protein